MGIKIVLTESQAEKLQAKVGKLPINEAKLACRYLDYESLDNMLGEKNVRKIGYETIIHRLGDFEIGIKYHNTDIIKIDLTNIVTLNTGGWETRTTKDRLNQFLDCRGLYIYQKRNVWYIVNNGEHIEYKDHMKIHPDGHLSYPSESTIWRTQHLEKIKALDIDPSQRELYGLSNDPES